MIVCVSSIRLFDGISPYPSSLSDLKNRSENSAGRGQILTVLQVNSRSIDQKSGEICTVQADLQPILQVRQAASPLTEGDEIKSAASKSN